MENKKGEWFYSQSPHCYVIVCSILINKDCIVLNETNAADREELCDRVIARLLVLDNDGQKLTKKLITNSLIYLF